jgi:hypothetical protein
MHSILDVWMLASKSSHKHHKKFPFIGGEHQIVKRKLFSPVVALDGKNRT